MSKKSNTIILGIETSCDETAASVIEFKNKKINVLSDIVSSQIDIHKKYGGVVPEVAAREHVLNIIPVINEALEMAKIKTTNASKKINAIAVTSGPGLITSLKTGVETAKVLSYAWKIPVVSVNHIEGHIYSNFIDNSKIQFPALILTVSGGHTMLVLMTDHGKYKIVGETRDDAAGEAFDKAAKLMDIGYPGGPVISASAEKFQISNFKFKINSKSQNSKFKTKSEIRNQKPARSQACIAGGSKIVLPRPMINSNDFDFSFSGLKTALLYELKKDPTSPLNSKRLRGASQKWKMRIPEYSHEFQQAIIDVLIYKTIKAAEKYQVNTIMLSGGVSANRELRIQMTEKIKNQYPDIKFLVPDLKYTTDNAVMIAVAGYYKFKQKKITNWEDLGADCNFELN